MPATRVSLPVPPASASVHEFSVLEYRPTAHRRSREATNSPGPAAGTSCGARRASAAGRTTKHPIEDVTPKVAHTTDHCTLRARAQAVLPTRLSRARAAVIWGPGRLIACFQTRPTRPVPSPLPSRRRAAGCGLRAAGSRGWSSALTGAVSNVRSRRPIASARTARGEGENPAGGHVEVTGREVTLKL
jgi:hypothetical protein